MEEITIRSAALSDAPRLLEIYGWYVEHMSFWLDIKCFFGTIKAVADHDGVVEGGTGTLHEEEKNDHK